MHTDELPASLEVDTENLAYAIWYWEGTGTIGHESGTDSPALVARSADGLVLYWAFSEELCAQDRCGYCAVWNPPAADARVCPGLSTHALHAFARASAHPDLSRCYLEFGAFALPVDLARPELDATILDLIRKGVRYAIALRD